MNLPETREGKCYLKLIWILKETKGILPEGWELGFDEIELTVSDSQNAKAVKILNQPFTSESMSGNLKAEEDEHYLTIMSDHFRYTYDKFTGLFAEMIKDNKKILEDSMQYNIWRAPTDNDMNIRKSWKEVN